MEGSPIKSPEVRFPNYKIETEKKLKNTIYSIFRRWERLGALHERSSALPRVPGPAASLAWAPRRSAQALERSLMLPENLLSDLRAPKHSGWALERLLISDEAPSERLSAQNECLSAHTQIFSKNFIFPSSFSWFPFFHAFLSSYSSASVTILYSSHHSFLDFFNFSSLFHDFSSNLHKSKAKTPKHIKSYHQPSFNHNSNQTQVLEY